MSRPSPVAQRRPAGHRRSGPHAGGPAATGGLKRSIVWLASYPKSGNTWLRVFLANYILNAEKPVPINEVHRIGLGDAVEGTYRMVARGAFDPADLHQVLALRPRVLRGIVANGADINLVKTHNRLGTVFGVRLIPPELTRSAIYIVRNPLDMVLSYARHYGLSLAQAVEAIGRSDNALGSADGAVYQFLGSWSEHVRGWTRAKDFPVLVLRYEDMLADPEAAFARVIEHLGMTPEPERLARAVRFSSFEELRRQEEKAGFIERPRHAERFFRSGRSGQWREELPADLAERVRREHGAVMRRFGYLDE